MNIDQLTKSPYESYYYAERYINFPECFRDKLRGDINKKYSSFDNDNKLQLPYLLLPADIVKIFRTTALTDEVNKYFFEDEFVRFPVHPQVLEEGTKYLKNTLLHSKGIEFAQAFPTASMRTLLAEAPVEIYIKTHFPERISSSKRTISLIDIKRGLWLSEQINKLVEKNIIPDSLSFMPDIAGMYLKEDCVGAILRDSSSLHPKNGYVLPLASLFAPDKNHPSDSLIIEQLAKHNKISVESLVTEKILTPHVEGFFWIMNELGTVFTPHGQNVLAEFNSNHSFVKYIHRDFQGKRILPLVLNAKGIPVPDHRTEKEESLEESMHLSLSYDMAVGKIFYDRMINALETRGYNTFHIIQYIKDTFHSNNKNHLIKFNRTQVEYTFENGLREVKDTKMKPKYR